MGERQRDGENNRSHFEAHVPTEHAAGQCEKQVSAEQQERCEHAGCAVGENAFQPRIEAKSKRPVREQEKRTTGDGESIKLRRRAKVVGGEPERGEQSDEAERYPSQAGIVAEMSGNSDPCSWGSGAHSVWGGAEARP